MRDFVEMIGVAVVFMIVAFVFMILLAVPSYYVNRAACTATWKNSKMEYRYSVMADCQIKFNGAWIPDTAFRGVVHD